MTCMQDRGERITPTVEEQLCFEIKTILLAGHETSAAMLTWSLLELTRHPDCLQKVSYTCMLGCDMLSWDTMLLCCMVCFISIRISPVGSCTFCMLDIVLIRIPQTLQGAGHWSCCLLICCTCKTIGPASRVFTMSFWCESSCVKFCVACLQVLQEALQVFGAAEQEPVRDAAESMQYTVACLKVWDIAFVPGSSSCKMLISSILLFQAVAWICCLAGMQLFADNHL